MIEYKGYSIYRITKRHYVIVGEKRSFDGLSSVKLFIDSRINPVDFMYQINNKEVSIL
jgi:hypothetical protein